MVIGCSSNWAPERHVHASSCATPQLANLLSTVLMLAPRLRIQIRWSVPYELRCGQLAAPIASSRFAEVRLDSSGSALRGTTCRAAPLVYFPRKWSTIVEEAKDLARLRKAITCYISAFGTVCALMPLLTEMHKRTLRF